MTHHKFACLSQPQQDPRRWYSGLILFPIYIFRVVIYIYLFIHVLMSFPNCLHRLWCLRLQALQCGHSCVLVLFHSQHNRTVVRFIYRTLSGTLNSWGSTVYICEFGNKVTSMNRVCLVCYLIIIDEQHIWCGCRWTSDTRVVAFAFESNVLLLCARSCILRWFSYYQVYITWFFGLRCVTIVFITVRCYFVILLPFVFFVL